jgi:DHA3 family macrolide efflux protein-like MFS transporter
MQASTPLIVPEAYLVRVAGMNEALSGVIYIVASPLAAWLLSVLSIQGILAIDVVTALLAITTLFFTHIPQPERTPEKRARFFGDLGEGARYLSSQRGLLWMVAIDALKRFATLPPFMMLPLLVTRHFGGGAQELGWLQSAYGLGYVSGGLILGVWGGFRRRIVTALLGLFGYGLSMLAMGAAPANSYWLAVAGYLGIGGMLVIYNGSIAALLQSCVPPEMQGRVISLKRSAEKMIIPLGLLASGPLADAIDVRLLFVAGGIVCFLCGTAWVSTPIIMRLERHLV